MAREKEYTNGEVTIVWKPNLCFHAKECIHGLPEVFDYEARPWIKAEAASADAIIETVAKCPSGALSYYRNADGKPSEVEAATAAVTLKVIQNGPILIKGPTTIVLSSGEEVKVSKGGLCRCGASNKKPFCDGGHKGIGFQG